MRAPTVLRPLASPTSGRPSVRDIVPRTLQQGGMSSAVRARAGVRAPGGKSWLETTAERQPVQPPPRPKVDRQAQGEVRSWPKGVSQERVAEVVKILGDDNEKFLPVRIEDGVGGHWPGAEIIRDYADAVNLKPESALHELVVYGPRANAVKSLVQKWQGKGWAALRRADAEDFATAMLRDGLWGRKHLFADGPEVAPWPLGPTEVPLSRFNNWQRSKPIADHEEVVQTVAKAYFERAGLDERTGWQELNQGIIRDEGLPPEGAEDVRAMLLDGDWGQLRLYVTKDLFSAAVKYGKDLAKYREDRQAFIEAVPSRTHRAFLRLWESYEGQTSLTQAAREGGKFDFPDEFGRVLDEAKNDEPGLWHTELTRELGTYFYDKAYLRADAHLPSFGKAVAKAADDAGGLPPEVWNAEVDRLSSIQRQIRSSVEADAAEHARKLWSQDPDGNFEDFLYLGLNAALDKHRAEGAFDGFTTKLGEFKDFATQLRGSVDSIEGYVAWAKRQGPDLRFGESIPKPDLHWRVPEAKRGVLKKLVRVKQPGDERDKVLLERTLSAISDDVLERLAAAGYKIIVTRNNVSNGDGSLRGQSTRAGVVVDRADGLHGGGKDGNQIIVRTRWRDGRLTLNIGTVMHEIGHAFDLNILGQNGKKPMNELPEFAEAFGAEHPRLRSYFHNQVEFAAEMFGRYMLDPERVAREFPQTAAVFKKLGVSDKMVSGGESLVKLQESFTPDAPVTGRPNPTEVVDALEHLNARRAEQGQVTDPYILELDGELAATESLARQLAARIVTKRAPKVGPYAVDEYFVHLDAATFNDRAKMDKLLDDLTGSHGALLYLDDLAQVKPTSPGFAALKDFQERLGALAPLVLAGGKEAREQLRGALPNVVRKAITLDPLTSEQVSELVSRNVADDGFVLTDEARAALEERVRGGDHSAAMELWREIKTHQSDRLADLLRVVDQQPEAVTWILSTDVNGAKLQGKADPHGELMKMVGLEGAKKKIESIIDSVAVARRQEELGLDVDDPPRLNLLFAGNPGTGKTTVAQHLSRMLSDVGYVRSSRVAKIRIQDLLNGNPEQNVKKLFEDNKDGVIFIDEFHQLKDTDEGKRAFRAMIPYLADKEYQRTVFIGAGYSDEIRSLVRDIDKGAERRFVQVPFEDYSRVELGQILDKMIVDYRLEGTPPEVREALLDRVIRKQRAMKHPGNAGDVETILGLSQENKNTRVAKAAREEKLTRDELLALTRTLTVDDVVEPPRETPEQVWNAIDELEGLENVKRQLREIQDSIEFARALDKDPLSTFEPYILLEGPAGSGKSTLAKLIGRLMAANDIVPDAGLVERKGTEMLGGFVGNSTALAVRGAFEESWGKTLFIDEIGALGMAVGGYEKQAAKEFLTQMEDNRGKFILVVADYPDNINKFLGLDAGLPRRFGLRLKLDSLGADAAASVLIGRIKEADLDAAGIRKHIGKRMEELVDLPAWAGGGDVRTLANKIWVAQAAAWKARKAKGENPDPRKVLPEAFDAAFAEMKSEVSRRPDPSADEPASDFAYATQVAHKGKADKVAKVEALTGEDQTVMAAMSEVDKQFARRFNNDPKLAKAQEADVDSDYNRAIAKKLGLEPEEAFAQVQKVKVKIRKMVKVMEAKEVQKFVYHCPFCGGVESPNCAYMGQSLEWKIQHSLRKPFKVTEYEEKMREVVEEHEV